MAEAANPINTRTTAGKTNFIRLTRPMRLIWFDIIIIVYSENALNRKRGSGQVSYTSPAIHLHGSFRLGRLTWLARFLPLGRLIWLPTNRLFPESILATNQDRQLRHFSITEMRFLTNYGEHRRYHFRCAKPRLRRASAKISSVLLLRERSERSRRLIELFSLAQPPFVPLIKMPNFGPPSVAPYTFTYAQERRVR